MQIGVDARFVQDQYHGIGRYTFNLLEELLNLNEKTASKRDTYHIFYNPSYKNTRFDLEGLLRQSGVVGQRVNLKLYFPQEQVALAQWATRLKLDIFHSPYFIAPLAAPCQLVITIQDLIFDRYPHYMPQRVFRAYYKLMTRLAVQRAAAIIVPSQATAKELSHFYPASKGKTYTVLDAASSYFKPITDSAKQQLVRERYQLPEKFILTIGTRRPHKNVPVLLAAFGQLQTELPHHLVIAGEADKRWPDDTRELAVRWQLNEQVHFPGHIAEEDLPTLYSMADLMVFPSIVEGFGLPPLEAMACGTPVIVSNCSALPEIALDSRLMVEPEDVSGLAARMLEVLQPAQSKYFAELKVQSIARASEFSWKKAAYETRQVYTKAQQSRPVRRVSFFSKADSDLK